jgi:hypothetical protein
MEQGELEGIIEESSLKLLQVSVPPVNYWLMRFVMGKQDDDPVMKGILKKCESYPSRMRLIQSLRKDGTWPLPTQRAHAENAGPGPPIGWTYMTMLRNLYELAECKAPPDEGHIRASLEKILSWQTEEGYIPGPTDDGVPLPHYNGFALSLFCRFGMEDNPRVRKLTRWLMSMQREDGGWSMPCIQDMKYLPEFRYMKMSQFAAMVQAGKIPEYSPKDYSHVPSCTWTTLMVIRGMAQSPKMRSDGDVRRAGSFFLDQFFKRNYHSSYYQSERNWTMLKYPTYYGSGLCGLDMLTALRFGPSDPRMDRPISWLVDARSKDGLWYQSDRPNPIKNQWITVSALGALARYARLY